MSDSKTSDAISRSWIWTNIMMLPHNGDMISSEEVEEEINTAPALDAVPVVRCKDCKYAHSGNGIWYWCGTDERKRPSSFYCSAGRKKDEYDDQP